MSFENLNFLVFSFRDISFAESERQALREQEKNVRSKKITPAVSGRYQKLGMPKKTLDGALKAGTSKKLQEDVLKEKLADEAVDVGEGQDEIEEEEEPRNLLTFKERYTALRDSALSNIPAELERAEADLQKGIRMAQDHGVADAAFVDDIQKREVAIAQQIADMIDKYENQIDVVTERAKIVEDDFEALTFSAKKINIGTNKTIVAPETIDKFQEILTNVREIRPKVDAETRTRQTALFRLPDAHLLGLSERPEIAGNAEKLLTLMGQIVEEAQTAVIGLNMVETTSNVEQKFIANSIEANEAIIAKIGIITDSLIRKIENQDPQLAAVSAQIALNLQRMIEVYSKGDLEFAQNLKAGSEAIMEALDFQTNKAARLLTINREVGAIVQDLEAANLEETLQKTLQHLNHEPRYPELRRQFGLENAIAAEVFDVDDIDIELEGGSVDYDEFFSSTKAQRMRTEQRIVQVSKLFENIADKESLVNVTLDFDAVLNDSMNAIDGVIENLSIAQTNPELSDEELAEIDELKAQAEEVKESLEKSREEIQDVLLETSQNQADWSFPEERYQSLMAPHNM